MQSRRPSVSSDEELEETRNVWIPKPGSGAVEGSPSRPEDPFEERNAGLPRRNRAGNGHLIVEENRIQQGSRFRDLTDISSLAIQGGDGTSAVCKSFEEADLPELVLENLRRNKFRTPTAIQRACLYLIQKKIKYDIVAQAETGSGKTAAYLLPIISHIISMKRGLPGMPPFTPLAMVIVPTRELAVQIASEARKFTKETGVHVALSYGQMDMSETIRELRRGCDILVGTPGRLLSHISSHNHGPQAIKTNFLGWTVVDEADDFLRVGQKTDFENLMGEVTKHTRRLFVFSATFTLEVVDWFKSYMKSVPFEIFGREGNDTIEYIWRQVMDERKRYQLVNDLREAYKLHSEVGLLPKVIVFVNTKQRASFVSFFLAQSGFKATSLLGDMCQSNREVHLKHFSTNHRNILVSTNVAARGLNVSDIKYVVNYDFPAQFTDVFTHRVGRTGRAGNRGVAISYFDNNVDNTNARDIIELMDRMGQQAPDYVYRFANLPVPGDANDEVILPLWAMSSRASEASTTTENEPPTVDVDRYFAETAAREHLEGLKLTVTHAEDDCYVQQYHSETEDDSDY
ncbi:hypothetical protein L596_027659 [Steinernema carpocapsae]|uniref:RNA helicase n=1 Tax=Steinernema carpocapsae TaxID=34508 RepID=A0A4U5LW59_STECR|nr:hypothetical protein L596_027659 [Steinernema carpocapsae]